MGNWGVGRASGEGYSDEECESFDDMAANGETTGYSATSITTFGAYPDADYEQWAKSAGDDPSVITFSLAPLTDLMTSHNFPNVEDIDIIKQFLADGVNDYCNTMLGEPCPVKEGCGLTYFCGSGYSCVDDPNAEEKHVCKRELLLLANSRLLLFTSYAISIHFVPFQTGKGFTTFQWPISMMLFLP